MEELPCIKLKISLQHTHSSVFDLSGTDPFDVFFEVDRFRGDGGGWRFIMLLLNGSLLDVPYALTYGLLELIDLEADCKTAFAPKDDRIARPIVSTRSSDRFEFVDTEEDSRVTVRSEDDTFTTSTPSAQPHNQFLTLLTRESGGRRKAQKTIPFCVSETIKHMLKPSRKYRLQTTSIDLGVKWWRYGSQEELAVKDVPVELLSPPEPGDCCSDSNMLSGIHRRGITSRTAIHVYISPRVIYRLGDPAPILKISITNTADQPVTMISFRSQPHITPIYTQSNSHARVISTSANISLENFSVTHMASGTEMVQESYVCVLQIGWQSRQFTTLEPGVPLVQGTESLKNATAILARMEHGEYKLKLSAKNVWWHWGTKEEILEGKPGTKRLPRGPKPPLMLASNDAIVFRLEEQT